MVCSTARRIKCRFSECLNQCSPTKVVNDSKIKEPTAWKEVSEEVKKESRKWQQVAASSSMTPPQKIPTLGACATTPLLNQKQQGTNRFIAPDGKQSLETSRKTSSSVVPTMHILLDVQELAHGLGTTGQTPLWELMPYPETYSQPRKKSKHTPLPFTFPAIPLSVLNSIWPYICRRCHVMSVPFDPFVLMFR